MYRNTVKAGSLCDVLGVHSIWRLGKITAIEKKRARFQVRMHATTSVKEAGDPKWMARWRICRPGTKCVDVKANLLFDCTEHTHTQSLFSCFYLSLMFFIYQVN